MGAAALRMHPVCESLDPADGSQDDEYRWELVLKPSHRIAGYGGRFKHCRNLNEVRRFLKTAVPATEGKD